MRELRRSMHQQLESVCRELAGATKTARSLSELRETPALCECGCGGIGWAPPHLAPRPGITMQAFIGARGTVRSLRAQKAALMAKLGFGVSP